MDKKRGKTLNSFPLKNPNNPEQSGITCYSGRIFWCVGPFTLPGTRKTLKTLNSLFLFVFRFFDDYFLGQPGPFLYSSGSAFHAALSAPEQVTLFGVTAFILPRNASLVIPRSRFLAICSVTTHAALHDSSQRAAFTVTTSCGAAVCALNSIISASSSLIRALSDAVSLSLLPPYILFFLSHSKTLASINVGSKSGCVMMCCASLSYTASRGAKCVLSDYFYIS